MAYGIIRVRKLTASNLKSTEVHNFRLFDTLGIETPKNIKTEPEINAFGFKSYPRHKSKTHPDFSQDNIPGQRLRNLIDVQLKERGIKPRSNSVLGLEYVVSASNEFFQHYSSDTFLEDAVKFIQDKHGADNVLAVSYHHDESTPHAHVVVLPTIEKTLKWKSRNGSGEKTKETLCADHFVGGRDKLRQLQTDYHKFCTRFNRPEVQFHRGT